MVPVIVGATAAAALLLAVGAFCFYRRRKASTMDKADESRGASSLPTSNPEPTELPPLDETTPSKEATGPGSPETRAAAKAKAAETAERPGLARKLSSFLFGEQEEEPSALTVAEAEEAPSAEQPPLPPRRTEPEPTEKAEEMCVQSDGRLVRRAGKRRVARDLGRVSGLRRIPDMARLRRGDQRIPRPRSRLSQ